jgi:hypothetical protein
MTVYIGQLSNVDGHDMPCPSDRRSEGYSLLHNQPWSQVANLRYRSKGAKV